MYGTHATDCRETGRRAPLAWPYQRRRWESNPLKAALQAAALPSGSSATSFSVLARSRTWSSTFAGSRAIRNTPRTCSFQRPAEESNLVRQFRGLPCDPAHPQGVHSSVSTRTRTWIWTFGGSYAIPCTIETFSIPTWSRTRSKALGKPYAIRYTIGTNKSGPTTGFAPAWSGLQDRRLSQSSHVGNQAGVQGFEPCRAALEAASSPRRTLLYRPPALRPGAFGVTTTLFSVTFQYASLMNFDQLSIRMLWSA